MTYFESLPETDDTLSGGCCYGRTTASDVWTEPAPLLDSGSYESQPIWEQETVSYEAPQPVFDPAAETIEVAQPTEAVQPVVATETPVVSDLSTSMTIGGTDPYGFTIVNADGSPADLGPSTMTIGGTDPYGVTGVSAPVGPATITIGPPAADSMANSLSTIYGVAAQNGDIMSQIMVQNIMASQNAAIRAWTAPSVF